jgi:hypothetical protein
MKSIFNILAFSILLFSSCHKETIDPNPPNPPTPLPTDTTGLDTSVVLSQQNWTLTAYRIGEFGPIISRTDTIKFLTNQVYTFNNYQSTYSFYPAMSTYNLTLNGTFLGNLSGSVFDYNLFAGQIDGNKFTDITPGGAGADYYLWLHRY